MFSKMAVGLQVHSFACPAFDYEYQLLTSQNIQSLHHKRRSIILLLASIADVTEQDMLARTWKIQHRAEVLLLHGQLVGDQCLQ